MLGRLAGRLVYACRASTGAGCRPMPPRRATPIRPSPGGPRPGRRHDPGNAPVWFRNEQSLAQVVSDDNEVVAAARENRGILFLTPHLGCFEITARYLARLMPMTVMFRPPRKDILAPLLETARNSSAVNAVPATMQGVREFVRALRRGESVGMLPDQAPGVGDGVWAPFFGRMAYTMTLPGKLATQTGVPIILTAGERLPGGRGWRIHYVRVPEPLPAEPEAQAALLNAAMETLIRRCPEQYLWSYNRYKTPRGAGPRPTRPRPPAEPERRSAVPVFDSYAMSNPKKTRTLVTLMKWFGRMRPSTRLRVGAALGWLALKLAKSRVRIVRKNLELCFPDQPEAVRERWVAEHFRALAQSIVDRGVLWYGTPEAVRELVTESGSERINDLTAQGRSVILLAPHFIGLDAAATRLTMEVPSAATMYTPQSDPHIDALVAAGRARFNEVFLVSRKDGVRDLVRHLRAPRPVYYLPDMDFGRQGAVFVPFFGVQAATLLATAQLAKVGRRRAAGAGLLESRDRQVSRRGAAAAGELPGEDTLEEATARLNRELEAWVRRCPSQYYWVHRRFKTRPPGEPKIY